MTTANLITQYDTWLDDESPVAALVMRQWLVSVEGRDGVIFPPTYAPPQEGKAKDDWSGYNIDCLPDGSTVCQIDSVGSQANRMEPIFKREKYKHLVPQVIINANGQQINLLDAGHRAADAIVHFSGLKTKLEKAFYVFQSKGDALPLARLAPTSIVFGSWDSRSTQAKLPRVVRSVIRAYEADQLHRSAQYQTIAGKIIDGVDAESKTEGPKADIGLAHVPAPWKHGGIKMRREGQIRRDAALNLVAIRALGTNSQEREQTLQLRRYIFGLSLMAFAAPQDTFLREGCQLVPDTDHPSEFELVYHDGRRESRQIGFDQAFQFAEVAAEDFGVNSPGSSEFDREDAQAELRKTKDQRKKDVAKRLAQLAKES